MQLEMKSKIRYLEISLYVISMIEYLQAELSIYSTRTFVECKICVSIP